MGDALEFQVNTIDCSGQLPMGELGGPFTGSPLCTGTPGSMDLRVDLRSCLGR